ncbi:MAG: TlpA disulfide reductase family protein [Pseudomonadota bacterium]
MARIRTRPFIIAMLLGLAGTIVYVLGSAAGGPDEQIPFLRFAQGDLSGLEFTYAGTAPGGQDFIGPDDQPMSMADLQGKVVLVNLWATWCAPCEKEMPTLGALQTARGGENFEVVAISVDDLEIRDSVKARLTEWTGSALGAYQANDFDLAYVDFKARGFPTSILYNRDGIEIARYSGELDWASYDAIALIDAVIAS